MTIPGLQGDSELAVATTAGLVRLPVVDGAFLWPDTLGAPHSSFRPASATPRARDVLLQRERDRLKSERATLDAQLAALDAPLPFEPAPRIAQTPMDAQSQAAQLASLARSLYPPPPPVSTPAPQPSPSAQEPRKRAPSRAGRPKGSGGARKPNKRGSAK